MRRAAAVLVVALLAAGCTASPPSDAESTPAIPAVERDSSPSPTMEGSELVTTDTDVYGLLPAADSPESIVAWAEDYCRAASLSPCTGVADRAVAMCIENRDCHPAVLVTFDQGTAAFLFGGNFQDSQVIAVWRPESDPDVARYGGARNLLEAYLLTVDVFPGRSD
ncbi:hypothetical protein [Cellulomonas sp. P5_C5]